ncbi:V-type ATP synthase subunit D [Streptomyces olivaceoviridis]|uniref:V-type ATP synthase subunit D n=1 Tax=Streptomyces olivaceoviridis TaxID=1921 RepID=UPI0036FD9ED4
MPRAERPWWNGVTARSGAGRSGNGETVRTRRRVRALRRHWIPRLRDVLAVADLALEEAEHEEAVRRRWAAGAGGL